MRDTITKVAHPEAPELNVEIWKETVDGKEMFFFDESGDGYDSTWCEDPEAECIQDAKEHLDYIYKNPDHACMTYAEYSEKMVFAVI